jgi:hypothetical protein
MRLHVTTSRDFEQEFHAVQNYCDLTLEDVTLDGAAWPAAARTPCPHTTAGSSSAPGRDRRQGGRLRLRRLRHRRYPDGAQVVVADGAVATATCQYGVWGSVPEPNRTSLTSTGGTFNAPSWSRTPGRRRQGRRHTCRRQVR